MAGFHLVLEHAIDQITVGHIYRHDLGELSELIESIRRVGGLLNPITITAGGVLIAGQRRLAALKELGYRTVPVWVVTGVSDKLSEVLAIQDENTLQKMLTPVEQAEMYAELKELLAEANARKQHATRFGASPDQEPVPGATGTPDEAQRDGGVESTPPLLAGPGGKTRTQAAKAVTGRDSHGMLDQVVELQQIAANDAEEPEVRQQAAEALIELNGDGKVNGRYLKVKLLQATAALQRLTEDPNQSDTIRQAAAAELQTIHAQSTPKDAVAAATRALAHLDQLRQQTAQTGLTGWTDVDPHLREKHEVRKLVDLLRREHGWWDRFEPQVIGAWATGEQWQLISSAADGTAGFITAAAEHRPEEPA